MSERLVVGIIADTSNPAVVGRLLGDLERLARMDPGLARISVVVLENPSGEATPGVLNDMRFDGVDIRCIGRALLVRWGSDRAELPLDRLDRRLPIAVARTLVQRNTFERLDGERGAVWILDEDLRLLPILDSIERGEPPLSMRLRSLRAAGVDVAIGPVFGAPPLPARSTVRVNLEDVWRHLVLVSMLEPDALWPDRSAENARVRCALPEYYYDLSRAHEDAGAHPMWLERSHAHETVHSAFARLCSGVGGLLDGVPVTRLLPDDPALDAAKSPLARGGNTIVLRPELLDRIPNVALCVGGRVSRRSDMVWARLAVALEGARFARSSIAVLQDRSGPGRSSFDACKLLDDVRGSALVAALDFLLGKNLLAWRRSLSTEHIALVSAIYVAHARARFEAIRRSEDRARSLLDQILSWVRTPEGRPGLLRHWMHAGVLDQLIDHVTRLRAAFDPSFAACDPAGERIEVEQFFLDLPSEIDAYRAGRSEGNDRMPLRALTW